MSKHSLDAHAVVILYFTWMYGLFNRVHYYHTRVYRTPPKVCGPILLYTIAFHYSSSSNVINQIKLIYAQYISFLLHIHYRTVCKILHVGNLIKQNYSKNWKFTKWLNISTLLSTFCFLICHKNVTKIVRSSLAASGMNWLIIRCVLPCLLQEMAGPTLLRMRNKH